MKRILIDARMFGPIHTGIGRYVKNLLDQICIQNSKYQITLLINDHSISQTYGDKFSYLYTKIKHYTLAEQLVLPIYLYLWKFDLVHFTHLNKPFLYFKTSVITIHDLIQHFYFGPNSTTRFGPLYWLKYYFYRQITNFNINHFYIIVPSRYWEKYILDTYKIKPTKIITTYEASDPKIVSKQTLFSKPKPYLVFTGNLYPHKNFTIILQALQKLPHLKLKVISKANIFQARAKRDVLKMGLDKQVEFLGFIPDSQFASIYSQAIALIHPSLMEGFSLPGLEAMALNCPIVSSYSSCLPEIHQKAALYFDPKNHQELIKKINEVQIPIVRERLIQQGKKRLKDFSWTKTAKQTLAFYDQILNSN